MIRNLTGCTRKKAQAESPSGQTADAARRLSRCAKAVVALSGENTVGTGKFPRKKSRARSALKTGERASDGLVQGTRSFVCTGGTNGAQKRARSSGFEHGKSWGGGGVRGEAVREEVADFSTREVQSAEAGEYC